MRANKENMKVMKLVMPKVAKFTQHNMNAGWVNQEKLKRTCLNKVVHFERGCNAVLRDEFPNVETVIFEDCDKIFFHLNFVIERIFPNLQTVISNCHPCEEYTLHKRKREKIDIFLTERWVDCKRNWMNTNYMTNLDKIASYIHPVTNKEFNDFIEDLSYTDPMFLKD